MHAGRPRSIDQRAGRVQQGHNDQVAAASAEAKEEVVMSRNVKFAGDGHPGVRPVTEAEADRVTELFTLAFYGDPT